MAARRNLLPTAARFLPTCEWTAAAQGRRIPIYESARGESSDPPPIRMIDGAIARAIRSTFGASRYGCQRAVKTLGGGGPSVARLVCVRTVPVVPLPPLRASGVTSQISRPLRGCRRADE
ncbi:hypothetical protein MTO96_000276 [Rhipicephalus appendiculatus]